MAGGWVIKKHAERTVFRPWYHLRDEENRSLKNEERSRYRGPAHVAFVTATSVASIERQHGIFPPYDAFIRRDSECMYTTGLSLGNVGQGEEEG